MWHVLLFIKNITKLSPVKEVISSQNIRKVLKRYVWSVTNKILLYFRFVIFEIV